ncbi:MAG: restriction endonuclease subunit S [Bacteroidota bacterium]|nr:restriction endonuclease subunit S [Bacteroidota bacterium]
MKEATTHQDHIKSVLSPIEQSRNGIPKPTAMSLPKDWKWVKLKDICEVVTGTTPPKSDISNYGNEIPFFKPPHLWDGLISETEEMLSLKGASKARVVPANTVLVTCIGNLGRTGFVKKEAAFNQQINAILENDKIDGKYIFYQAQSPTFRNQLEKLATGTTVSIVNKGNFETINIPLAPPKTQQAIVSKIEELFSELDKGIEDLKTAQQQLKTYRQSVLKWAFEGKLSELRRVRLKDDRINDNETSSNKNEILKSDNPINPNSDEGELPEGWERKRLENICNLKAGNFVKASEIEEVNNEKLYNCFGGNGLRGYTKSYTHEGLHALIGRQGALCGNVHLVDGKFHATEHAVVVTTFKNIDMKCLFYKLKEMRLNQYSSGVAQPGLSVNKLLPIEINFPLSIEEQHRIVQEIESRLSVADKMEESIAQSLQQAEALRQSILKRAFEGKLV